MHSKMKDRPKITVGLRDADIVGADDRALQAAVDYVAGLGGGVVEIGEGEFTMRDSLHLRSFVTVRGTKGKTILRKAKGVSSPLAMDGDYGEEQITVTNPEGFKVGFGVAVWDSQSEGFHTTVARVNGCRGGGIFLYRGFGTIIENCVVRKYHGDGISFQQSNDVLVKGCVSEDNAGLGLHPGSGSQRPVVRQCIARRNGEDGLYLCWRVRHGLFEKNILEDNGRFGISIGHKDTDNLLEDNQVRFNHQDGVFFRNESEGMAGHRNRLEKNLIENNGVKDEAAGIRVRGETRGLVFKSNIIRDTRTPAERKQSVGIRIDEQAGEVVLEGNQIEARTQVEDQRKARP